MNAPPIRDAASVVLHRQINGATHVLMGQRGKHAAFMPNKYVFPGGAVDLQDADIVATNPLNDICRARLALMAQPDLATAIVASAIREVWEETGLILGSLGNMPHIPEDWASFSETGHAPSAQGFRFFFRAITPPGRPRRFDARFFLVDASHAVGDLDDFSRASDELSHLHWVALTQARQLDLPFITEVVLAEIEGLIKSGTTPPSIPFFKNDTDISQFLRLK